MPGVSGTSVIKSHNSSTSNEINGLRHSCCANWECILRLCFCFRCKALHNSPPDLFRRIIRLIDLFTKYVLHIKVRFMDWHIAIDIDRDCMHIHTHTEMIRICLCTYKYTCFHIHHVPQCMVWLVDWLANMLKARNRQPEYPSTVIATIYNHHHHQ